jgi:hypothetical protein
VWLELEINSTAHFKICGAVALAIVVGKGVKRVQLVGVDKPLRRNAHTPCFRCVQHGGREKVDASSAAADNQPTVRACGSS